VKSLYLPTFSGLPRWFACELTDILAQVDVPSEDAAAGSARHRFFQRVTELMQAELAARYPGFPDGFASDEGRAMAVECALQGARELALAEAADEHQEVLAAIPLEQLGLHEVASEVTFALDLETGEARELGRGLERGYAAAAEALGVPLRPTEIVGTIDRLALIGDDGLYIGDYKGRSHKTAPGRDPQFLAAALAASRVYHRSWAEIEVIRCIGEQTYAQKERVDLLDLDSFEVRLQERRALREQNRAMHAEDPLGLAEAEVGDHCRYCPSLRYCPAQMAIARAALGGDSEEMQAIVKVGSAYITDESAPRLHALVKRADELLEIVKSALKDFARQTPFQLADGSGRWYGVPPDAKERELLDGRRVEAVLAEIFGAEAAKTGVKVEGTFSGIESAVKAYLSTHPDLAKRGAIKELRERAEALLQERGLLRTISGGQVKIFKPKDAAPKATERAGVAHV
jgi:hypothetical protein